MPSHSCKNCDVGQISTGKTCLEAPIDLTLPTLQNLRMVVDVSDDNTPLNYSLASIQWDAFTLQDKPAEVAAVSLQWSDNLEFPPVPLSNTLKIEMTNDNIRTQPGHIPVTLDPRFSTLQSAVIYVRARTLSKDGQPGEWSTPSEKWFTPRDCLETSFLNISTNRSWDPQTWKCFPCPEGSSCSGDITYHGVLALFGYWRVPDVPPNEFIACPFPGACLGAPNIKFEGKYMNESMDGTKDGIDYAMHRFAEGCNEYFGFE